MKTNSLNRPLEGLKVIEMAALGPVPFCSMMLADMGADVVRIDRSGSAGLGFQMDNRFDMTSRGHRSVSLDLRCSQGVEVALKLIESADILLEGMRPGAMERLGLGPEPCMQRNAALIYGRMTGWGQSGPMSNRAGHDINYISMNGVLHSIGLTDGPPVPPLNLVGDYGGGAMFLITGVLAALHETRQSGKGQIIDAAMMEGASYLMSPIHSFRNAGLWQSERGSNLLDSGAPYYRVYETSDARHMAVGAIEPKFYKLFVEGLGLDLSGLPDPLDQQNWATLIEEFTAVFMSKTLEQWSDIFLPIDACVTPVLTIEESINFEHNCERNSFVTIDGQVQPNLSPRFSRTKVTVESTPIKPGQHSKEILKELEISESEIDGLYKHGVVSDS